MRIVRVVILIAALLCISRGVYADPVTILPAAPTGFTQVFFSDTNGSFRWQFTWDGVTASINDALRGADDEQPGTQWNGDNDVNPNNGPRAAFFTNNTASFFARHITRADPLDVQMGDPYAFTMNLDLLVQTRTFSVLSRQCVPHQHNPDAHEDCYLLGYTRPNLNGPVTFEFSGVHVPEPTTLLLITTGLAGIALKLRRRFNKHQGE
jgi:PEP-CTERM motif-containing protein